MPSQPIAPEHLELDTENPRFGLSEKATQHDALKFLFETSDIKELWLSINANGFLDFEPLVAWQPDKAVERYVVVEGNRRLAAVKTLLDPSLITEFSKTAVPEVSERAAPTLETLPVSVIQNKDDADEYIGFRHVNGARTWDPIPKAKFSLKLLSKLRQKPNLSDQERIAILSQQIGDQPTQLIRNMFAFMILQQADEKGLIPDDLLERKRNDFSHLYSILSNPDTREYIGLGAAALKASQIKENPIPETHLKKLGNLMNWLFGSPDGEEKSLISRQGQDRPALQKVIAHPEALSSLEHTRDFQHARQLSGVDSDEWMDKVYKIDVNVQSVWSETADIAPNLQVDEKAKTSKKINSAISKLGLIDQLLK
ncbi:MAG: ParB/Srx family N-terminal domain-containing protein [Erythrobacter sp.]